MTQSTLLAMLLTVLGAYLLGSISFSYLTGRVRQQDLRQSGSGNLGAMNTARILGPAAGVVVLMLDLGKGWLTAWFAWKYLGSPAVVYLACIAVLLGHNYSIFMKFRGGKGIATVGGFLLLLSPKTFIAELLVGALVGAFTRDIRRAAIGMILTFSPLLGLLSHSWTLFAFGLVVAFLSALRHQKDFRQLWAVLQ